MSELKFSCPNCAQHLSAEEACAGAHIACPNCQTQIVVPGLPKAAMAEPPPPISATAPATFPRNAASNPAPGFCGLAIGSFALALSTLPLNVIAVQVGFPVGLLGCVPAVVCGHLALGRIPFKIYFEAPRSYETIVSGNYVADLQ